jgi:YggT family protein
MGNSYLSNPAIFLIQTLFGLYVLAVLLRMFFQLLRADFYNPVSQFIVKITHPILRPMRRFIPPVMGIDTSSLLLAWGLKAIEIGLILLILGASFSPLAPLLWAIPALVELVLNIFLFAIIIQALLSWIQPDPYNPVNNLLATLTRPVLRPFQQIIQPISGFDLAPMAAIVALYLLQMLLLPPLRAVTGTPLVL